MTSAAAIGQSTTGKPINLSQLQTELTTAGVQVSRGLGLVAELLYTYDVEGTPVDFPTADQPTVGQCIANHVAMRDKTDAELAAEFQAPGTTTARKQDIRDMQSGLMPREQVPITQSEWDAR